MLTASGNNLVLRWLQRESGAPTDYDIHTVTLPTSGGKLFYQIDGVEN